MNAETVLHHYIVAALWSSTDEHGNPLDAEFTTDDLTPEALEAMREDVTDFLAEADDRNLLTGLSPEQVGHDFWLTRNHHGAGFWDRGLGEQGELLTELAHAWGDQDLYVGDDGLIYAL